ncbi:protein SHORT-ROOT-like [Cynara cardunculus var. scolymus]|uniref:Uncharacterized protein n=1 Tax=Cynara cardunculus var. scolymus TaxID=59895 RepID=A0A103XC79_CYNCS|nr:protein SHORT-ROOT-like [Cynara cardunculus var. scolymus]KVH88048.1 hypothetical protein Ccrd_024568 [Cynara cardunculus var. scolymus]
MKRKRFSPYTNHRKIQTTSKGKSSYTSFEYSDDGDKWAYRLLQECAHAISQKDSAKIHHLLWMLNELASSYGDFDQKLASYFMKALFCKVMESGQGCYKKLVSVADKSNCCFDSARNLVLKFQEVSPWTTFGRVACNGAILEAFDGETKLHIIDVSNTLCTQWPTLLEALATRSNQTPSLKLTVVVTNIMARSLMKEIAQRMDKFAHLMGVPFEFKVICTKSNQTLGQLTKEELGVEVNETIAVNCIGGLTRVEVEERGDVIKLFSSLKPRVVTIVEEEADFTSTRSDFINCFAECLRFYTLYFEMLEESFTPTSNERLILERGCSRSIVRVLSCDDKEIMNLGECERREKGSQWCERLKTRFSPLGFSDDVVDDLNSLLRRYRTGWSLAVDQTSSNIDSGIYLAWKEEPVVWASVWKP